jgi:hypothetical protein
LRGVFTLKDIGMVTSITMVPLATAAIGAGKLPEANGGHSDTRDRVGEAVGWSSRCSPSAQLTTGVKKPCALLTANPPYKNPCL